MTNNKIKLHLKKISVKFTIISEKTKETTLGIEHIENKNYWPYNLDLSHSYLKQSIIQYYTSIQNKPFREFSVINYC